MPKTLRPAFLLLALAVGAGASAARAADDASQEKTLPITHVDSRDAAMILRAIAGTKGVTVVDDHTLSLRDTSDHLALAEDVVKMVDIPSDATDESSLAVPDGSRIVTVLLKQASNRDVLKALRVEIQIKHVATLGEHRLFLRDTEDQIQRALDRVHKLDSAGD